MSEQSQKQLVQQATELKARLVSLGGKLDNLLKEKAGPELPNMLTGREQTESYLSHPDRECRCAALTLLTDHWKVGKGFTEVFQRVISSEPDAEVRAVAISCLGSIYRATGDRMVGAMLARLARNVLEDLKVREAAYRALLQLSSVPVYEWPPVSGFGLLGEADWLFVDSFLNKG